MEKKDIIIGCHVSMKAPKYLTGSLEEALSYKANAFMIYTGAPQNTIRKPVKDLNVMQFHEELKKYQIPVSSVIVHAPYIINLANTIKPRTFEQSVDFLRREIGRCEEIGINTIILHPGSTVGANRDKAIEQLIKGLDEIYIHGQNIRIALETMAGKGGEIGSKFEELAYIINNVKHKEIIGVCWDTCHLYDSGYDIKNNLEEIITEFDKVIGLNKLFVIHVNDSKFGINSHKDRHANIGMGHLGFEAIDKIVYHEKFYNKVKILETPYVNGFSPFKEEIAMIRNRKFDPKVLESLERKK